MPETQFAGYLPISRLHAIIVVHIDKKEGAAHLVGLEKLNCGSERCAVAIQLVVDAVAEIVMKLDILRFRAKH